MSVLQSIILYFSFDDGCRLADAGYEEDGRKVKRVGEHWRIMLLTIVVLGFSLVIPVLAAFELSWHLALRSQQDQLSGFNSRMIRRANLTFENAMDALRSMIRSDLPPCSDAHIAQMQLLTANNQYIAGIGFVDGDGFLRCTTLGRTTLIVKHTPSKFTMADGIGVIPRIIPRITGSEPRIVLYLDSYDVLVDPELLVDVTVDQGTQLAVALESAGVLSDENGPDPDLIRSLLADPKSGSNDTHVYSAIRSGPWTAIAIQTLGHVDRQYERQKWVVVPFGILVSSILSIATLWKVRRSLSLEGRLTAAIKRRQLTVHYQPIIDIANGACIGAEALVRWPLRNGGFISPELFIPVAERNSLIQPLTDMVIAAVMRDMSPLLGTERSLHMSINLSAVDVASGRVLEVLEQELRNTGGRPEQIWLEATERGFIDIDSARDVMVRAHQRGYSIAIDDFGTGYSSLQYLESLPLDALKIDKSFVHSIGKAMARSSVTPHIIEMAQTLDLACIAEGVETDGQLEYLARQGVQFAQGWLFSKPLPAKEFHAFYARRKAKYGVGRETIRRNPA